MDNQKIEQLDNALLSASKNIRVLSTLAWPGGVEEKFLEGWHKGKAQLPTIHIQSPDLRQSVSILNAIVHKCDQEDPVEKFLAETALSYAHAGNMLMNVGTTEFTRYSSLIYGRPDIVYKNQGFSGVDSAKFFLEITDKLLGNKHIDDVVSSISANDFAKLLRPEVDKFFIHDKVEIIVDPKMSSKAIAGANRIRVRDGAFFSQLDYDQLLHHEAFVHSATQLNGRSQLNLKSLGLGAPRTTRTQEGIAVFAELITNSIDIHRLRRIALRVIAVQMALDGADFLDLFKFFLGEGQSEIESIRSTQRIFRGGAVKGGVVFTKDAVYLQGLLEVHTFLRIAIRDNRPDLVDHLFAGRLTMADALRLTPMFEKGWLIPPKYKPSWANDLNRLAASMAFSAFIANIKIDNIQLDRIIEIERENYG